jgi:hypothetical protein
MSAKSAIAFFLTKEPANFVQVARGQKPRRPGLSKAEKTAVTAYLRADKVERKALLRADKVNSGEIIDLDAFRRHRRDYMRTYRSMKRLGTILL